MAYDNTNRGILFLEDSRETDRHPDYTGKVNVNGAEYRLAGWVRTSEKTGKQFLSLSVSEFKKKGAVPQNQNQPANNQAFDDGFPEDEIPF